MSARIAFVGADGALGARLVPALGARGINLRCSALHAPSAPLDLSGAYVTINAAGPRVRPGLGWVDYLREHVGTASIVAGAVRPGAHLVLISSAAVYGSARGAVDATTPPMPDSFPVPAYAWAKLAAEHATRSICADRGVALTILRPSIIYGSGAGGVLITLRNLARRGMRAVLEPESTRQHLLHLELFQRVLEQVATTSPPAHRATYVVADPFVLTSADLNDAYRAAGPRSVPLVTPVGLVGEATRRWNRGPNRQVSGLVAVASMLALDNAYDWKTCLDALGIDPEPYGRARFDEFIRA